MSLRQIQSYLLAWSFWLTSKLAMATGLPAAPQPANGAGSGDYLQIGWAWIKEAGIIVILTMGAIGFIAFASSAWSAFGEARRTGEWGNFSKIFIIGIVLLVFTLFFLNIAKDTLSGNPF